MASLSDVSWRHGLAHVSTLDRAGVGAHRVARLCAAGALLRVRAGIYALPDADPAVVRAARVGGRLAGRSAARALGLWAAPEDELVVEVARHGTQLRNPDDFRTPLGPSPGQVRVRWTAERLPRRESFGVAPLPTVLSQVLTTEPAEHAIATIDSVFRLDSAFDLDGFARSLPARHRALCDLVDPRSESGSESIVRVLLVRSGIAVSVQPPLGRGRRSDLLVGDRLLLECDSRTHHEAGDRVCDLRRDADNAALGFVTLRFDYSQILFDPDSVVAAVRRYIDLGLHRWRH
ncbi:very-short-patch-repair endonuclease [Diaminobutyricimonas aerilata]|uniref:Very-short-patch-repair endonuclease n=1 Tax=Diaminobutyricimonas aerilata TaxID=1162967 RepID=A0A2M9CKW4_9MICO|nr:type IV toxin-antitoxin system AbiEi family antitoxin domain-containing protein [Diaminobutyricimonas aerilata]PJJ72522.1 very-short-patch-repair endonuclease [Diaminobutyricimonas aerilata]